MSVATSERVLPAVWQLTAAELERICGRPTGLRPTAVLVDDVEGLCRGALADGQRRGRVRVDIEPGDWMEALGFLLGEIIVISRRFDPSRQGIEFRPWLYERVRLRVVDATRFLYGRQGQHRIVKETFSEVARRDHSSGSGYYQGEGYDGFDNGTPVSDRVDPASLVDPADRFDARQWLDAEADRDRAGVAGIEGVGARGGAANGDRGAGAGGRARGASRHWVDCVACGWRNFPQAPNGVATWHFQTCGGCGADLGEAA